MIVLQTAILVVVTGGLQVEIEKSDGARLVGELVRVDTDSVELQVEQQRQLLPAQQLRWLRPVDTVAVSKFPTTSVWIELTDGSQLQARDYRVTDQRVSLQLRPGVPLQLATEGIRSVRFSAPHPQLDQQWQEITQSKAAGDILVIRRPNQILDYLVGQVGAIDEETLKFLYDGQWIDVRRARIDGMIHFAASAPSFPAPKCRLTTLAGDVWQVQTLTQEGEQIVLTSNNGTRASLAISVIEAIDYGSSATVYLSDLEPNRTQWTPLLRIESLSDELRQMFQPRRDRSLMGGPLRLRLAESERVPQEFQKGLSIHSRTELVYRLGGEYRQFAALAGLDPGGEPTGSVTLVVSADGTERWRKEISATLPAVPIDLDVTGVNWLTVLVDYGDQADVSDHLNLCDARLVK